MNTQMMNETNETKPVNEVNRKRAGWIGGAILIAIGAFLLLNQFTKLDIGAYIPLGLGVLFLLWGAATRNVGLLIPGGILSGIGAGALLVMRYEPTLSGEATGGVFLLAFAAGWALITVASALFTKEVAWWPLIPGAILALIGAGLLGGETGLTILKYVGMGWPVILILLGVWLLFKRTPAQK